MVLPVAFAVECKPDKVLVEEVLRVKAYCLGGKGEVVKALEKGKFDVAVADEDPLSTKPKALLKYRIVKVTSGIYKRIKNSRVIISVSPRLEDWILEACREAGINPRNFGLPDDPKRLHREINYKIEEFRALVRELIKRKSKMITELQRIAEDC